MVLVEDLAAGFSADRYDATLGGVSISLVRVSPTRLGFSVPDLPPGTHSLVVTAIDGVEYGPLAFEMQETTAIEDPVAAVHERLDRYTAEVVKLDKKYAADDAVREAFAAARENLANVRRDFDALDGDGQVAVAAFLAANAPEGTTPMRWFGKWNEDVVKTWSLVGIGIVGIVYGDPWAKLGGAALFGYNASKLVDLFMEGTATALQPFDGAGSEALSNRSLRRKSIVSLSFVDQRAQRVPFKRKMKNVSAEDIGSTNAEVAYAASIFLELHAAWEKANAVFGELLYRVFPEPPDLRTVEALYSDVPLAGNTVLVEAVTGDVTLSKNEPLADGAMLAFTSPACSSSSELVPFSFEIVHADLELPEQRATITATLRCRNLCEQRADRGDGCKQKPATCDGNDLVEYGPPECDVTTGACVGSGVAKTTKCADVGARCVVGGVAGAQCEPLDCASIAGLIPGRWTESRYLTSGALDVTYTIDLKTGGGGRRVSDWTSTSGTSTSCSDPSYTDPYCSVTWAVTESAGKCWLGWQDQRWKMTSRYEIALPIGTLESTGSWGGKMRMTKG